MPDSPTAPRVCAVLPPVAVDGPALSIRRFRRRILPLESFADDVGVVLLHELLQARCNLVVAGATSSGKTSLVAALVSEVDPSQRLVIVEDTAELPLRHPHAVRLEARPPTIDGPGAVDLAQLVRTALRLRPDRIVVGEVRGDEVLALVQAMNTGHDGSISTCHANSPTDALLRLESLVLQAAPTWPLAAIRHQLARSIDVVIHVERAEDGARRITELAEVTPPSTAATTRRHPPHARWRCRTSTGTSSRWRHSSGDDDDRPNRCGRVRAGLRRPGGRDRCRAAASAAGDGPRRDVAERSMARRPTSARARFDAPGASPPDARAVAAWCDELARSVRSGSTLRDAVAMLPADPATERVTAPLPIGDRPGPVGRRCGRPGSTLAALTSSLALGVISTASRIGGPSAASIDRAAMLLRQRAADLDERATQAAQARLSSHVMTSVPLLMLAVLVATDDDIRSVVTSPIGAACVAAGLALNAAGWWWMRHIVGVPS